MIQAQLVVDFIGCFNVIAILIIWHRSIATPILQDMPSMTLQPGNKHDYKFYKRL